MNNMEVIMGRIIRNLVIIAFLTGLLQPGSLLAGGYVYNKVQVGAPFIHFDSIISTTSAGSPIRGSRSL